MKSSGPAQVSFLYSISQAATLLSMGVFLSACGAGLPFQAPGLVTQDNSASSVIDLNDPNQVGDRALKILSQNCTSCHTGSSGPVAGFILNDMAAMTQAGLISPGSPDQSRILQSVEANRMPPTSPLSAFDKSILRSWIAGGALIPSDSVLPTGPDANPAIPQLPVTGTLEQKAVAILSNNCYACHGVAANGGVSRINDPAHLIATGLITPGTPAISKIFTSIQSGAMPKGASKLSLADLQIISDWITAGAQAPAPGTAPPPPELPPLGPTYASLRANVFLPKCAGCHSGTKPADGIRLDSYSNVRSHLSKSYQVAYKGEMPPRPNPKLSSAELSAIAQWMKMGAPNN